MSNINWDEAPEWANTALTTSNNWQGKETDAGNVEFAIREGSDYWSDKSKEMTFTISDEWWRVVEYRPQNIQLTSIKDIFSQIQKATNNKYERELTDRYSNTCRVDVYDVLLAFEVTCPAIQHAIKKLLCTGIRGHKDSSQDLLEAKESITRAIELATKS